METGDRIRAARRKVGITQKALGEKLEMTQQQLAQYENGVRNPKPETLRRIAEALDVHPVALMDLDSMTIEQLSMLLDETVARYYEAKTKSDKKSEPLNNEANAALDEEIHRIQAACKTIQSEIDVKKQQKTESTPRRFPLVDNRHLVPYDSIDWDQVETELRRDHPELFEYEESINRLTAAFDKLNTDGVAEAVKRVEELTEIPRYQRKGIMKRSKAALYILDEMNKEK